MELGENAVCVLFGTTVHDPESPDAAVGVVQVGLATPAQQPISPASPRFAVEAMPMFKDLALVPCVSVTFATGTTSKATTCVREADNRPIVNPSVDWFEFTVASLVPIECE